MERDPIKGFAVYSGTKNFWTGASFFGKTTTIFLSISKKKFPFPCDVEVGDDEEGQ